MSSEIHNLRITPGIIDVGKDDGSTAPAKTATTVQSSNISRLKHAGIVLTNLLPFSTRGLPALIAKLPIALVKGVRHKNVSKEIKAALKSGISDNYKDLSPKIDEDKSQVRENIQYAAYMYPYNSDYRQGNTIKTSSDDGCSMEAHWIHSGSASQFDDKASKFEGLIQEFQRAGFKEDKAGIFYNERTGSQFCLVYNDKCDPPELAICLEGLDNDGNLSLSDKLKTLRDETHHIKQTQREIKKRFKELDYQWEQLKPKLEQSQANTRQAREEEGLKYPPDYNRVEILAAKEAELTREAESIQNEDQNLAKQFDRLGEQFKTNQAAIKKEVKAQKSINNRARKSAIKEFLGGVPMAARDAIKLGEILKKATDNTNITPVMVGHSHGGGQAQCGALANGIKGVVFNSRPMGVGVRRFLGDDKVVNAKDHITAFSGGGDWLTRTRPLNMLAIAFERTTGIPVARTVGQGYNIPAAKRGKTGLFDLDTIYQHKAFLAQMQQLVLSKA